MLPRSKSERGTSRTFRSYCCCGSSPPPLRYAQFGPACLFVRARARRCERESAAQPRRVSFRLFSFARSRQWRRRWRRRRATRRWLSLCSSPPPSSPLPLRPPPPLPVVVIHDDGGCCMFAAGGARCVRWRARVVVGCCFCDTRRR